MACGLAVGAFKRLSFDMFVRMLGKSSYEIEGSGGAAICCSSSATIGRMRGTAKARWGNTNRRCDEA